MTITIDDNLTCNLHEGMVQVNGEPLFFNFSLPETLKGVPVSKAHQIMWKWCGESKLCYYTNDLYQGELREIQLTNDDWETCIKPFADQWQAEKDRIAEEQAVAEAEYNKFENRQFRAYDAIRAKYEEVTRKPYLISSVGFTIDANSAAYQAIDGLINRGETVENFKDYYNKVRQVTVAQMEIMRDEIVQQDSHLKEQKWAFLDALKNTSSNEQLDEVMETCVFSYLDFSGETVVEIPVQ